MQEPLPRVAHREAGQPAELPPLKPLLAPPEAPDAGPAEEAAPAGLEVGTSWGTVQTKYGPCFNSIGSVTVTGANVIHLRPVYRRVGNIASTSNFNQGTQAIRQMTTELANAQHDLSKVTINAPIEGIITKRNVEQGETAMQGFTNNPSVVLLTLADLSVIEAEIQVDETDIPNVAVGQKANMVPTLRYQSW